VPREARNYTNPLSFYTVWSETERSFSKRSEQVYRNRAFLVLFAPAKSTNKWNF